MNQAYTKNIKVFFAFNFLACFRPHWPIAVLYYQSITDSYASAMMVFSIIFLSQALLEVPTGLISDLLGRRKSMIVGALASLIALVLYATGLNIWVLFVGAFCEGLGRSLFSGTDKALLYETLQEQERSNQFETLFGKISSVEQISLGTSAVVGGFLALISLQLVMWVAVIPALLSLIISFYFVDVKRESKIEQSAYVMLKEAVKGFVRNRRLRLVSTAEILDFGFGEASFYFQAAFFNLLIPQWLIGVVRGIHHLFGAIGFWSAGKMIQRLGHKILLISGNIITSLIILLVLLIPSALSPFVMAILNVEYGCSHTAKNGLMQSEFSDQQRSTMGSIVSLTGSLFFAVVSILLGYIADISTPIHAMLFGLSGNLIIIWIYSTLFVGSSTAKSKSQF